MRLVAFRSNLVAKADCLITFSFGCLAHLHCLVAPPKASIQFYDFSRVGRPFFVNFSSWGRDMIMGLAAFDSDLVSKANGMGTSPIGAPPEFFWTIFFQIFGLSSMRIPLADGVLFRLTAATEMV